MSHWSDVLVSLNACREAVEWARTRKSYADAWRHCPRADWMLWLAARIAGDDEAARKQIALVACACARTALRFVPRGEKRPLRCIQTVERWARGKATIEDVMEARAAAAAYAAYAAAACAAYAAAAYAAAAYAAYADAAYAAAAAADAAYAAAAAAADAAACAARTKALRDMAKTVRAKIKRPALPTAVRAAGVR